MWNCTAETLNPRPTTSSTMPASMVRVSYMGPLPRQYRARGDGADERQRDGDGLDRRTGAQHRVEQQDEDPRPREGDDRRDAEEVDVRRDDRIRSHHREECGAHFSLAL